MLTEKYRPRSFDEIVGHKRVVETLRGFVAKKNIPNILFVGRAGTGKHIQTVLRRRSWTRWYETDCEG